MFSKTERKVHFKCDRSEIGRRVVTVRIPVRTAGAGAHAGHIRRFLSSSGSCYLDAIKIQVTSFWIECAVGFFLSST